jgi:hypothetical protein
MQLQHEGYFQVVACGRGNLHRAVTSSAAFQRNQLLIAGDVRQGQANLDNGVQYRRDRPQAVP